VTPAQLVIGDLLPSRAATILPVPSLRRAIMWGRLPTCGRLLIGLPGLRTLPENSCTISGPGAKWGSQSWLQPAFSRLAPAADALRGRLATGWQKQSTQHPRFILVNMRSTVSAESAVRRSVSLPPEVADEVNSIANARRVSQNRALVDLISDGIVAYKQRRSEFFALADRFQRSRDSAETERLREELARMTFGA